jgi:putative transposase
MNSVYRAMNITKQAFHSRMKSQRIKEDELGQLLPVLREIRMDHPYMSSRQMYKLIKPKTVGRDRFETFCFENGFKITRKKTFKRTTNSNGVVRFDNFLRGYELNGINQAWVSDITYYEIGGKFYYLTFIMDLFSRQIVGYSVSENLFTEQTTIPALKQAMKLRNTDLKGLIIHSDGGGQYYCAEFLELTKGLTNSMGKSVYENIHAERINGTIKNQYLAGYKPQNFAELKKAVKKAITMYNTIKPHKALMGRSPIDFELELLTISQISTKEKRSKKENITPKETVYI